MNLKVKKSVLIAGIEKARDARIADEQKNLPTPKTKKQFAVEFAAWKKKTVADLRTRIKNVQASTPESAYRMSGYGYDIPRSPRPLAGIFDDDDSISYHKRNIERITEQYNALIRRVNLHTEDTVSVSDRSDFAQYL